MLGWRRMAGRWEEGVHNTWLTPYRHWQWAQLHLVCLKNTPSLPPSPPGIFFISPSYKMLSICCCCCIPVHCLPPLFSYSLIQTGFLFSIKSKAKITLDVFNALVHFFHKWYLHFNRYTLGTVLHLVKLLGVRLIVLFLRKLLLSIVVLSEYWFIVEVIRNVQVRLHKDTEHR